LALVRSTSALTGIALGLNLFNALLIGVLGVPGLILLLLSQWVLA
jgi:inhibitor of the pro-sigma K processing machinery